jgi:hypothetical protein
MAKAKRATKRTTRRAAALALGAAGVSLTMTGGASATAPTNVPLRDDARRIFLGEEEIADVSLATFHVFDRETESRLRQGLRLAAGVQGGCGITRGCGPGGCVGASCAAVGGGAPHGGGAAGGCAHAGGGAGGGCAGHGGGCAGHGGGCAAHMGACAGHGGGCAGHGCRGCAGHGRGFGGCGWGGVWLGIACLGSIGCTGSCWQWDPYLGRWINVCY